ncbi:hypothetical protein FRB98_006917 [Tulasnella sp. 332]|nr:hypothetical protein FRB98_006917 [Tulasnella sp. 332]
MSQSYQRPLDNTANIDATALGNNKTTLGQTSGTGFGNQDTGYGNTGLTGNQNTAGTGYGTGTGVGTDNFDNNNNNNNNSSHLGRDAAISGVGAAGLEHEHRKHDHERRDGEFGQQGGNLDHNNFGNNNNNTSHLGRDAAIGGVGAAGLEHEHRKHDHERRDGEYGQGGNFINNNNSSHLGRDAAIGGVGAAGLEHEHRKHEHGRLNDEFGNNNDHIGVPNVPVQQGPFGAASGTEVRGNDAIAKPIDWEAINAGRGAAPGPHFGFTGRANVGGGVGQPASEDFSALNDPNLPPGNNPNLAGNNQIGRDAALGGVGAGGLGQEYGQAGNYGNNSNDFGNTNASHNNAGRHGAEAGALVGGLGGHHDGHTARDAALGAGAGGLAGHEYREHEQNTAGNSNSNDDGQKPGLMQKIKNVLKPNNNNNPAKDPANQDSYDVGSGPAGTQGYPAGSGGAGTTGPTGTY